MLKWVWVSVLVIALDQLTKLWASSSLSYNNPVPVMPSFNFTLMYNTGAAFSFLSEAGGWQRWFFAVVAVLISTVLLVWLTRLKAEQRWLAVGITLVLGGALGNVWDRLHLGHVIDFIQIYYRQWSWPAFNVADMAIVAGAVMLVLDGLRSTQQKKS